MRRDALENRIYDVAVIGAGVIGSAIARELCRYDLSVCIIEKNVDVCEGTSKANSAIVHGGFDAKPGTMKAKMNVIGNRMMDKVCEELDVPFKRNGAMVISFEGEDSLSELVARAKANGVEVEIVDPKDYEENISSDAKCALLCKSSGIVCPFELTLGYAENAVENGADIYLNTPVLGIKKDENFTIHTSKGNIQARCIVNAAGVYADAIHDMYLSHSYTITPRKGEYLLYDRDLKDLVSHTIFQLPGKMGKGVLVTPTIHGNLLAGPSADDLLEKDDLETTDEGLAYVLNTASKSLKDMPSMVITSFAGLRAHGDTGDFVLDMPACGFFEAACIESPGLTSAPAIGEYMAGMVAGYLGADLDPSFNPVRKKRVLDGDRIICRCESVTEGEILAAIHSTIGARTLDGVKRRVRAGSGRCQGGFCSIKVMEILARELDVPFEDIRKNTLDSVIVFGKTK
ncbi:MAG: NAD(P)/FAD-dependent oxidoreductase [Clostridia bacterium]|nr:NAD(P)/FAD-dependent oxidoreductase [Clostridia bacterium]